MTNISQSKTPFIKKMRKKRSRSAKQQVFLEIAHKIHTKNKMQVNQDLCLHFNNKKKKQHREEQQNAAYSINAGREQR